MTMNINGFENIIDMVMAKKIGERGITMSLEKKTLMITKMVIIKCLR